MQPDELAEARHAIDEIDAQVVHLLNERARLAQSIGATKNATARATFAPDREQDVLSKVQAAGAEGPLTAPHLISIYRQIMSACRALEGKLRVAYLGPAASFTHQAAFERFGDATDFVPVGSIPEIFNEVQRGGAEFGVVAIENSTEGPVTESLDLFIDSELKVCSEIAIPIAFQLASKAERSAVKKIYSNPVALAQCRQWLAKNMPGVEVVTVASNSGAAATAAGDPTSAAVTNALSVQEYGLNVIATDIQDVAANYTRFYVVAPTAQNRPTGADKSAVIFSIRDHVGALRDVADVFARHGLNMNSIQSRPSRRRVWDYVFYVEFLGHEGDPNAAAALAELREQCVFVKVIGSWPIDPVGSLS
jgi:chorismate mutase / prephenate dehydratase